MEGMIFTHNLQLGICHEFLLEEKRYLFIESCKLPFAIQY